MFLLYVVGEEDPIGFSWLLCWILPHVVDIVAGGFRCCPVRGSFYRLRLTVSLS